MQMCWVCAVNVFQATWQGWCIAHRHDSASTSLFLRCKFPGLSTIQGAPNTWRTPWIFKSNYEKTGRILKEYSRRISNQASLNISEYYGIHSVHDQYSDEFGVRLMRDRAWIFDFLRSVIQNENKVYHKPYPISDKSAQTIPLWSKFTPYFRQTKATEK